MDPFFSIRQAWIFICPLLRSGRQAFSRSLFLPCVGVVRSVNMSGKLRVQEPRCYTRKSRRYPYRFRSANECSCFMEYPGVAPMISAGNCSALESKNETRWAASSYLSVGCPMALELAQPAPYYNVFFYLLHPVRRSVMKLIKTVGASRPGPSLLSLTGFCL